MTQGSSGLGAAHARLAEIDRELAQLRHRHDIAMSAFLFEEAAELGRRIAELDRERQALAADLPAPSSEPTEGIIPVLARPRRRLRQR